MSILVGSRVTLRPVGSKDAEARLALGHSPEIASMLGGDPALTAPLNRDAAEEWAAGLVTHPHAWIIEQDGRLIGEIRLDGLNAHDRRARLAVSLHDPVKLGRGLGREAIRLVLRYAFVVLRLNRVGLRVVAYNTRAIRCYLACGFIEEGREREAALVEGEWHDDVMMGVLAREFDAR